MDLKIPSPLQKITHPAFAAANITVYVKRDDLIHPVISGNKWRKLQLNIEKYKAGKYDAILTFGGAYSNHIRALAAAGKELAIPTLGIIRGEELTPTTNQTLAACAKDGMQLHFVTREEYSWRYEMDYKQQLRSRFGNILVVEEGGANFHGVMGCTAIVAEVTHNPDYYILAAGTGTTAAGILFASDSKVIGVPVFKKGAFIEDEIKQLLYYTGMTDLELNAAIDRLVLATDYHFGGYGKWNNELIAFMNAFYKATGIKTDQIYTAKLFYALIDLINQQKIERGSTVVAVHTGGLQGIDSIKEQLVY